MLYIKSQIIEI